MAFSSKAKLSEPRPGPISSAISEDSTPASFTILRQVINEIGGGEIMEIIAINKADVSAPEVLMNLLRNESNAYAISARTGYGVDTLVKAIEAALPKPKVEINAVIPFSRGDLVSAVHEQGEIISEEYLPEGTKIHAMVGGALAQKIQML